MSKLWHDDIRPPPDATWLWARTNAVAQRIIERNWIHIASLDHDLGGLPGDEDELMVSDNPSHSEETGLDFARWLVANKCVPEVIIIHSWNPAGAHHMATTLRPHAHVVVQPYGSSPDFIVPA